MLRTLEFTGLGKQVSKNGKYLDKTKNEYRKIMYVSKLKYTDSPNEIDINQYVQYWHI